VTSVSPPAGATSISTATTISVTFSEPMNQAQTAAAFSLSGPGGAVAGSTSWSGNTLRFTPSGGLAAGTVYTAVVSTAAADVAGNTLAGAQVWSFTTATSGRPRG
jgi:hypothetical protein